VSAERPMRACGLTGLGSRVTPWNPSLRTHSPNSGVTLLLIFGTTMSMVRWNVIGLQPIGEDLIKDKFCSCFMYNVYSVVYHCL